MPNAVSRANVAGVPAEGETEEGSEPASAPVVEEAPAVEEGAADLDGEEDAPTDRGSMRYRKQRRGGKGVRDIRTNERNGPVIGIVPVSDNDDIMLITTGGMVNRTHASEVRVTGRNTQGVRVMGLNDGDKVASLAKIAREDEPTVAPGDEVEVPPDANG